MIKLKSEINKTAVMRDLRKKAENMYEHTYEGELRIEDFMSGANTLFNLLRLPPVMKSVCPDCFNDLYIKDGKLYCTWCQNEW